MPVSGPAGAGEYFRSLAVARAVHAHWPAAAIRFILNREAPYAPGAPFPTTLIDGSPTHAVAEVNDCLRTFRPEVVVFDSAGRASQLRLARELGARCVYVSSRAKTRWKGFRLRRMRYLSQHWLVGQDFPGWRLGPLERLKLALARRPQIVCLPTFFDAPQPGLRAALLARLGVAQDGFVLFCAGGAGHFAGRAHGPSVFHQAACHVAGASTLPCLVVGAPRAPVRACSGVTILAPLPNAELMALMAAARLCVINGGSLLMQGLAQGAACLCAPIAGDQARLIRACARRGLVRGAPFDGRALGHAGVQLLAEAAACSALRQRARDLGLRNGTALAVEALASLLHRAP